MPSYTVRRSTTINKAPSDILAYLANYRNWPTWSPWLVQEPDCELTYSKASNTTSSSLGNIGDGYEWQGKLVGAGSMELTEKSDQHLAMKLSFLKPFKSQAKVEFEVQPVKTGEGPCSEVTWVMHGNLPWFLFFLKNMFKNWIAMDYDRGLLMLKSQLENGHIHSKLDIIGKRTQDEIHYIALKGKATLSDLGPMMEQHFKQLGEYFENHNIEAVGVPFALYETMDKTTTESEFYSCMPIAHKHAIDKPFIYKHLPSCDTYVIKHTGDYHFMGNAWATAMSASRYEKVKVKYKPMGMERYLNDPCDTEPKDLESEVILFKR